MGPKLFNEVIADLKVQGDRSLYVFLSDLRMMLEDCGLEPPGVHYTKVTGLRNFVPSLRIYTRSMNTEAIQGLLILAAIMPTTKTENFPWPKHTLLPRMRAYLEEHEEAIEKAMASPRRCHHYPRAGRSLLKA